jgi:hypothetical protein
MKIRDAIQKRTKKVIGLTLALMMISTAAFADWVTATDGVVTVGGISGGELAVSVEEGDTVDVTLAIVTEPNAVDGGFNPQQDCNIFPNPATLTLTPSSSSSHATVPASDIVFSDCSETKVLTITGVSVGSATITFTQAMSQQGDGTWRTPPTIAVTVTEASTPPPPDKELVCSNPAAPAWANHILRASGIKLNSTQTRNYVAQVAHYMGPGTDFNGVMKDPTGPFANDAAMTAAFEAQRVLYGAAVHGYLKNNLGLNVGTFNPAVGPNTTCIEVPAT